MVIRPVVVLFYIDTVLLRESGRAEVDPGLVLCLCVLLHDINLETVLLERHLHQFRGREEPVVNDLLLAFVREHDLVVGLSILRQHKLGAGGPVVHQLGSSKIENCATRKRQSQ